MKNTLCPDCKRPMEEVNQNYETYYKCPFCLIEIEE